MESLFTPWRFNWVASQRKPKGCLFCRARASRRDGPRNWVLFRGRENFIILNRFPYNNGHLMVVPNDHVGTIGKMKPPQLLEMMELVQRCERALHRLYRPQGFNLGMNLGKCSGAGIEEHLHLHLVPRWAGDTNFMAVLDGTRILPEDLEVTFRKIREMLQKEPPVKVPGSSRTGKRERRDPP